MLNDFVFLRFFLVENELNKLFAEVGEDFYGSMSHLFVETFSTIFHILNWIDSNLDQLVQKLPVFRFDDSVWT